MGICSPHSDADLLRRSVMHTCRCMMQPSAMKYFLRKYYGKMDFRKVLRKSILLF